MADREMKEMAPWGKPWCETSKSMYRNAVINLGTLVNQYRGLAYGIDLLCNPCFEIDSVVEFEKGLNLEGSV